MSKTTIAWTEHTWNPVRGCSRVSEGCRNCYAERMAARGLPGMNSPTTGEPFALMTPSGPRWTGKVELIESALDIPLRRKKPTVYFVNSMSDLFHESLPDEAIDRVVAVMARCPQHTFQVLTKRPKRMLYIFTEVVRTQKFWPIPNVHLGVSVEDPPSADERIPFLLMTPAAKRFVSYEPALNAVEFERGRGFLTGESHDNAPYKGVHIDQIIVGGESGPQSRPFDIEWARQTIQQCWEADVRCFVKQLGARPGYQRNDGWHDVAFRDPKGGDPSEWPEDLMVRETL